ncbi:unnamed protein product [Kuraishia capsulata CBS 1993]|uniref:Uncharacterized protein n=1 Tax=Kuraishia capsulata CBS 1993 TaxID=1382522 RepID=W6MUI4_9ASCO|nr:uncharacterized protein KUCA_T00005295001 [Kuraishia capsulata CBS 1993]CDK29307.1 unnamed protein product [Kuraishia capsulata CBS 1993]
MLRAIPRTLKCNRLLFSTQSILAKPSLKRTLATSTSTDNWQTDDDELYSPDFANLPVRWEKLSEEERADTVYYLEGKQELPWELMSTEEKKAAYFLAYGKWGPRNQQGLNTTEVLFRFVSTSILFSVLGLSAFLYTKDRKVLKELELQSGESSESS